MSLCVTPNPTWPECEVPCDDWDIDSENFDECLYQPWFVAAAIHRAALLLAEKGPCIGSHFNKDVDANGSDIWVPKGGSDVAWGEPQIKPECCGAIALGIVWPTTPTTQGECLTYIDHQYRLKVSWCPDTSTFHKTVEAARFDKHLTEIACCLVKPFMNDGMKAPKLTITEYTREDPEDTCDQLVFTIRATN